MADDTRNDHREGKTPNANAPVDRASGDRNSANPLSRKDTGPSAAERLTDLERQQRGGTA
jgi:hypothetical protein